MKKKIHRHPGYVQRIYAYAKFLAACHTTEEIREKIAEVRARKGDREADYLRQKTLDLWKKKQQYGRLR